MKNRYVIDTNVLIAASAVDANSPIAQDATPDDPLLRQKIWEWLDCFQKSAARLVLDGEGKIEKEYSHKLGFNDFGIQVLINKWSRAEVDVVQVQYDAHGHAILDDSLQNTIQDRADRKMVAAALEAKACYKICYIAFAGDTDWHAWESALKEYGLELEALIPEWSYPKYLEKLK